MERELAVSLCGRRYSIASGERFDSGIDPSYAANWPLVDSVTNELIRTGNNVYTFT